MLFVRLKPYAKFTWLSELFNGHFLFPFVFTSRVILNTSFFELVFKKS